MKNPTQNLLSSLYIVIDKTTNLSKKIEKLQQNKHFYLRLFTPKNIFNSQLKEYSHTKNSRVRDMNFSSPLRFTKVEEV